MAKETFWLGVCVNSYVYLSGTMERNKVALKKKRWKNEGETSISLYLSKKSLKKQLQQQRGLWCIVIRRLFLPHDDSISLRNSPVSFWMKNNSSSYLFPNHFFLLGPKKLTRNHQRKYPRTKDCQLTNRFYFDFFFLYSKYFCGEVCYIFFFFPSGVALAFFFCWAVGSEFFLFGTPPLTSTESRDATTAAAMWIDIKRKNTLPISLCTM